MANQEHVDVVLQGAEAIKKWRKGNTGVRLDLSAANLSKAKLSGAKLSAANLSGAKLSGANLIGAKLSGADLGLADLGLANLIGAKIRNANLKGTELNDARFRSTILADVDLSKAKGLETVSHAGPSTIGTDTLAKTGIITAEIETFLRGCGLESWEIETARLYDQALDAEQISEHLTTQIFSKRTHGPMFMGGVFISYAHANVDFVDKLCAAIMEQGIQVYLDRRDFVAGSIEKNISRAIRINDQVVLVLSEEALKSKWVWDEIATTLEKEEEEGRDILFPIAVNDSWQKNVRNKRRLMREIKERLILDFSQEDTFDENLRKLIMGMKINR